VSKRKRREENMKKRIAIILSHTQIHQLEEPTAPTAELEEFSDYDHLEESLS